MNLATKLPCHTKRFLLWSHGHKVSSFPCWERFGKLVESNHLAASVPMSCAMLSNWGRSDEWMMRWRWASKVKDIRKGFQRSNYSSPKQMNLHPNTEIAYIKQTQMTLCHWEEPIHPVKSNSPIDDNCPTAPLSGGDATHICIDMKQNECVSNCEKNMFISVKCLLLVASWFWLLSRLSSSFLTCFPQRKQPHQRTHTFETAANGHQCAVSECHGPSIFFF